MKLSKKQTIHFKNKSLDIQCLFGALWITWPDCGERVLKAGQSVVVASRGKICIHGLSPAELRVEQLKKGCVTD